jgi:hypothetical protein
LCSPCATVRERDEEGCSRTVEVQRYDRSRPYQKGTSGWQSVLSRDLLSTYPVDGDGCVRWGFLLQPREDKSPSAVFGVARADAKLQPQTYGTDDRSWGVLVTPLGGYGLVQLPGGTQRGRHARVPAGRGALPTCAQTG